MRGKIILFFAGFFFMIFIINIYQAGAVQCGAVSCSAGQTCVVGANGVSQCVSSATIVRKGAVASSPTDSCLPNKPSFLDAQGVIKANFCFGKDGKDGTADDCGCPSGKSCQTDGSCKISCTDGTAAGQCSKDRPLYCDRNGVLIQNGVLCSCPANKPLVLPNGECASRREFLSFSAYQFDKGANSGVEMNPTHFVNAANFSIVDALGCAYPQLMVDEMDSLFDIPNFPTYEGYCSVPLNAQDYAMELDFGSPVTIDEVEIHFGFPFITDYEIDYWEGSVWRAVFKGKNTFNFNDNNYYSIDYRGVKYYVDPITGDFAAQERFVNGKKYMIIPVKASLDKIVTTTKIRIRPTAWQEGAVIYQVMARNKDSSLRLSSLLNYTDSQNLAQQFFKKGYFESKPLFTENSKNYLRYSNLTFVLGSFTFGREVKSNSINVGKYNSSNPYPRFEFFDDEWQQATAQQASFHYYGRNGDSPYSSTLQDTYNINGNNVVVAYNKKCINDGAVGLENSPLEGKPCVAHPASTDRTFMYVNGTFYGLIDENGRYYTLIGDEKVYYNDSFGGRKGYFLIMRVIYPQPTKVDRVVLHELKNKIIRVDIRNHLLGTIASFSKVADNKALTRTQMDISPVSVGYLEFWFYFFENASVHEQNPLITEIETFSSTISPLSPVVRDPNTYYNVSLQFRSASTKEEVLNSPWYGADGVLNSYFNRSGQSIGSLHDGKQWFQYRVFAQTPSVLDTPIIDNISVSYSGNKPQPPVARIQGPASATAGTLVFFSALRSSVKGSVITSFEWDFGDGFRAKDFIVNHTYTASGKYSIKLTVTDSAGLSDTVFAPFIAEVYDCLTPEAPGNADTVLFNLGDSVVQQTALNALREYANKRQIALSQIDTAEEMMDAALSYISAHMSYRTDDESKANIAQQGITYNPPGSQIGGSNTGDFAMSLPITLQAGKRGCSNNAAFCGDCEDFSIMFTTLVRAMGVNSKCVYSVCSTPEAGHCYNVVNYYGRYRVIEPQYKSLTYAFSASSLSWNTSSGMPYYFAANAFNDKVNSYSDFFSKGLVQNADSTDNLIRNNVSSSGLPSSGTRCAANWPFYQQQRAQFGSNWDPASLFGEVCPW